eukprot:TRINITY_DN7725_c0_g1_i1.p1 TRINITY_DN7725_c0_g1~~TRINITY_DN7725_c0_g1_i1.p1  ORF type:complete len:202 (+),score=26.41 TRINITY_DN7725_c0_g1_i1:62-667(+)
MLRVLTLAVILGITAAQIPGVVLAGFDVVAYHDLKPTDDGLLGDEIYFTHYKGWEFWFVNQTNVDRFNANPEKFVPQWGGFCSWGIAYEFPDSPPSPTHGYPWVVNSTIQCLGPPCDPKSGWAILNDKLYCSINRNIMDRFIALESTNHSIEKGDARWTNWFGSTTSPPFNTDCNYPKAWYSQCMYRLKQMGCCALGNCDN